MPATNDSPPQRNQYSPPREPLVEIPPAEPLPGDWVAIVEIADMPIPAVKYTTVEMWRARARHRDIPFPEPDDHIGSFPIWRLERIEAWFTATGKPYQLKTWRKKRAAGGYRRKKRAAA